MSTCKTVLSEPYGDGWKLVIKLTYFKDAAQRGLHLVGNIYKFENGFSQSYLREGGRMKVLPMGRFSQKSFDEFNVPEDKLEIVKQHILATTSVPMR